MIKKIISKDIQQTLIIGITIFVILLFLGGRFMYGKTLVKLLDYKKERKRVELENKVGRELNKLQKIRKETPEVKESSKFLAEIAKIAGQLNLKLKSISAVPMEKYDEFTRLGVELIIDTSFHELGFFVSRLEASELPISVSKLDIKSEIDNEKPAKTKITASIVVNTFSLTDTILEK